MRTPRLLLAMACGFTTLMAASVPAQASFGEFLYHQDQHLEAFAAGMSEYTQTIDGIRWHYYARHTDSSAPCVVLVHGYTAEASNWFRFAMHVDHSRCVIAPDLPGFGQSDYSPALTYRISEQTRRLQHLLAQVKPHGQFDLVGSSMGGHIVVNYTLNYPAEVRSLTLFDAAGITPPQPSDNDKRIASGAGNSFEIHSYDDFDRFLPMTMANPPWMPSPVRHHLADEFMARDTRYKAIFTQIYRQELEDKRLGEITKPTLIIWGKHDRLIDVSTANAYHQGIKGSTLIIMPELGHLPFVEAPGESATDYQQFLSGIEKK